MHFYHYIFLSGREPSSSEIELNIYQASKYNFEAHTGSTLERKILGTNDIVMDPLRFTYEKNWSDAFSWAMSFL